MIELKGYYIIGMLVLLLSCHQTENISTEQPTLSDSTGLAQHVDSFNQIEQDGLDHIPLNTGRYGQLPPALTQILNRKYAGWVLPVISKEYLKKLDRTAQGPYYLHEDLNGDTVLDYVVQFQVEDSTTLAAYLMSEENKSVEYILEKHPAVPGKPEMIISQDPKGKKIKLSNQAGKISLLQNAIVTHSESGLRRYIFQENKFVSFKTEP